jgi:transposase, IS5 family
MFKGMFDVEFRLEKIDRNGDPLLALNLLVNWEMFRPELVVLRERERKSPAGARGYDPVLMFKVLVLQSLYNLSDGAMEAQMLDRLSFMRFLGLGIGDKIPDEKTIWVFREQMKEAGLIDKLFSRFDEHLRNSGFAARKGQIVDASIVEVPRQRNTRDENEKIKNGGEIEDWKDAKRCQKDVDARWTKKNGVNHYGFKNHVCVDVKHKLIRAFHVTDASVHDSNVFTGLLDPGNTSADVYADSAYRSEKTLEELEELGFREHIQRKGQRGKPLTDWEKQGNRTRSKIRSRVEHVFGAQLQKAGDLILRAIGLARAVVKIGLRNLAYNLQRFVTLVTAPG